VIIFGFVRFLPIKNNQTEKKTDPKPNRNRPKPTGFGSVSVQFLMPKTEKTYMHFFGLRNGLYYGFLMDF
jgi:hypothetical protein